MKIEIEKGVPIPHPYSKRTPKYPWRDMEIGDSFIAHGIKSAASLNTPRAAAQTNTGYKFLVSTTPDGVRVWRIA